MSAQAHLTHQPVMHFKPAVLARATRRRTAHRRFAHPRTSHVRTRDDHLRH
jgi:hypothetical protein